MRAIATLLLSWATLEAFAQVPMPEPAKPPAAKAPADPGLRKPDPGAVVTPPPTGTEEIIKTPRNVDPKMDDATADIDRRNVKRSRDKARER